MLTEICQYLRNYFDRRPDGTYNPKYFGDFTISHGSIEGLDLADGQYIRILGSLKNDGVHASDDYLESETFNGAIWFLSLPPSLVRLADEIADWQAKYGGDSPAMSPYQSESFDGYSYTKASGANAAATWQDAFGTRLNVWRKI